jgi:cysteine desulfurase/selenocysteine lyase
MTSETLDVEAIRRDFPIFAAKSGHRFVYLDSAASAQRPSSVINVMDDYYQRFHANVHRGVYTLAEEATQMYEHARVRVGNFIGAPQPAREIVFTKNATEAFNLVSQGLGRVLLDEDSVIVLTEMEHHANLVPWLILQEQLGFKIRYLPFDDDGYLVLDDLDRVLEGAKLLGVTMMSNVLGTINPMEMLVSKAHEHGALVLADAAQYAPHFKIDVANLGIDLMAITGHKMLGPTGIGALWARAEILEMMKPFLGGGDMITDVRLDGFIANEIPHKFEAGTPPIAEAIGWSVALDYLEGVGFDRLHRHEAALTEYALNRVNEALGAGIKIYGPKKVADRGGVISFDLAGVHPHDVAQVLDKHGVCVRAGHHCAKPLMRHIGIAATARASLYLYNDRSDIDVLVEALLDAYRTFN